MPEAMNQRVNFPARRLNSTAQHLNFPSQRGPGMVAEPNREGEARNQCGAVPGKVAGGCPM